MSIYVMLIEKKFKNNNFIKQINIGQSNDSIKQSIVQLVSIGTTKNCYFPQQYRFRSIKQDT